MTGYQNFLLTVDEFESITPINQHMLRAFPSTGNIIALGNRKVSVLLQRFSLHVNSKNQTLRKSNKNTW